MDDAGGMDTPHDDIVQPGWGSPSWLAARPRRYVGFVIGFMIVVRIIQAFSGDWTRSAW
jgi:hypothetical protein